MDGARSLEGPRQWGVWWACLLLEEVLHHGRSGGFGTQSSAVLRGTHCHLHVGLVPHVSESSPSAVLQRRLIRRIWGKGEDGLQSPLRGLSPS
jgi:hypothetical protein